MVACIYLIKMMTCQCRYPPLKLHTFISKATHDYPHAFFKKSGGDIVFASVCSSCHLLLNHWKIQPNLVRALLTIIWRATAHVVLAPTYWGPGEGPTCQKHLISITKSNSKIFIPNVVCVLKNERYKVRK